jgi:hypothetical protein
MGLAQRKLGSDVQRDLFGVEEAAEPAFTPRPEHILNRLVEMLAAMRAAKAWPWDEVHVDLYRNYVWPHLIRHLSPGEAETWNAHLAAEATRLDAA